MGEGIGVGGNNDNVARAGQIAGSKPGNDRHRVHPSKT
jgi:hypothetical protein